MISKKKISVLVEPIYLEDHSDPSESSYLWAYKVKIKNRSPLSFLIRNKIDTKNIKIANVVEKFENPRFVVSDSLNKRIKE